MHSHRNICKSRSTFGKWCVWYQYWNPNPFVSSAHRTHHLKDSDIPTCNLSIMYPSIHPLNVAHFCKLIVLKSPTSLKPSRCILAPPAYSSAMTQSLFFGGCVYVCKHCSYLLAGDCMDRGDSVLNCRSNALERLRCFLSRSSSFCGQFCSTGVPEALSGCRLVPGDTNTLPEEALPLEPADCGVEKLMITRKKKKHSQTEVLADRPGIQTIYNYRLEICRPWRKCSAILTSVNVG